MANESLKEKQALLQSIQSITERTNQLNRENAGIVREIADSQDLAKQAQLQASASQSKNLSDSQALANIDAIRSIQAKAIAEGTLDQFDAVSMMEEALVDVSDMSEEVLDYVIQQADKMEEITKEMKKQDIFGESRADRMKEVNDAAKENSATMKDVLNSAGLIVDELASMKTLILAAVAGLAVATKEGFKLARALGDGNMAMDTMRIVGVQLSSQFQALGRGFVLTGEEARQSITALVQLNGSLQDATAAAVTTVGEMAVKYGIGFDEAAKLNKTMLQMSNNSQEGADALMNQVKHLAKAKGVAPGAIMKDIADNSMEFARFGKDGASGLVNAAANAKKLGLNLETVVAAGDSLLDVQGSIQKEMKAEMMLGRQLNLDAARQAALTGDRDTLVKEIAKNAGSLAEFEGMSVVQQRSLADAMGVQVGDVVKILQAKQKGVNLDSKVLENQKAVTDATEATAVQAGLVAQGASSIAGGIFAAMPALAGMKSVFGGLIPKGKGGFFGKIFGNASEQAADVSDKMSKIKTPKDGGKGMTGFFKSLSKIKTSSMIKAALAIAIVAVSLIPAAYAFSLLEGVDPVTILAFGATMIGLALALSVIAGVGGPMIAGALAFGIASIALIPAAYAMNQLTADPASMLAFAGAVAILGLGIAAMGALAIPIAIGTAVLFGLSKVLPGVTAGFANLSGVDGATLSAFAMAILPLGLGLAAFGVLSPAIALGVAALALTSNVLPSVTAGFSALGGISGDSTLGFSLAILPLGIGLAAFGALSPAIVLGVGALAIAAKVLPSTVNGLSGLGGVSPSALKAFVGGITPLGLGLALFGALSPAILLGTAALAAVSLVLPLTTSGLAALGGIDPNLIMTFANALIPLSAGVAAFGVIAPLALVAAVAMAAVGGAIYLFASAFSLMAGVDSEAIKTLRKGIRSMIGVVEDIGLVQAGKLLVKAAAIGAVGLAVLPFGKAISLAGQGDATGLLKAVEGFSKIDAGGLMFAGFGMSMLSMGFAAFIPIFPFMGMMAESLALMIPQLAILAPLGEQLVMAGLGMMGLGYGMLPFGIGLMIAAPFIPLLPIFAAGILLMTPPLMQLSTIAPILPIMGMGFMMLGIGLQPFAIAMAMLFPFQAVLPVLAQAIMDMASPLAMMAPLGPQIMYLASAIGALGIASALATYPLLTFGTMAYYAAPAVYLLGEASKVLGAGLEAVKVPLLAMAAQFPMILGLSAAVTTLGISLLAATPGVFAFGAGAYFAMVPVLALASGLELMVSTADGLTSVGAGLSSIASGLSEISQFKGTIALLTIAAPALALLGATGVLTGGGENNNEGGEGNGALIAKIDELIAVINSKDYEPVLQIDGRKEGTAVARKRAPRGMGT